MYRTRLRSGFKLRPAIAAAILLGLAASLTGCGFGGSSSGKAKQSTKSLAVRNRGHRGHVHAGVKQPALHAYASALLPALTAALPVFDRAAGDALRGAGPGGCGIDPETLSILAGQADGVPHAAPWYYAVGQLHHQMIGAYKLMMGATDACGIAAQNGDDGSRATAVNDMNTAAVELHQVTNHVRSLAHA